jgi:DNA modification methylase
MNSVRIIQGDVRAGLAQLPAGSAHCCVTSPPYWGLRAYGVGAENGELGSEPTPAEYIAHMVDVFRGVWRVLRDDGTLWLNMGDSYAHNGPCGGDSPDGARASRATDADRQASMGYRVPPGLKPKDLCGVPWRLAFALQADGWYLRQDIIWHKPSPMPESVTDRCTKAHEYLYLLTKRPRYYFDATAIAEEGAEPRDFWEETRGDGHDSMIKGIASRQAKGPSGFGANGTRNKRDVWTVASQPFPGAHFATFPPKLIEPCILAGTSAHGCCPACGAPWRRVTKTEALKRERPNDLTKRTGADGTGNHCANTVAGVAVETVGWEPTCKCPAAEPIPATVLDPFMGAGTTGLVSAGLGRNAVGCELNPEYVTLAKQRITDELGLIVSFQE